jgi:DNA (cytosine-5)-methyltransferase 1
MLRLGGGQALSTIVNALEKLGYKWAYRIVDAMAFGLPQRRLRVYIVASLVDDPREVLFADECEAIPAPVDHRHVACGFYWTEGIRGLGWAVDAVPPLKGGSSVGVASPPAVLLPNGRIVTPSITDAERLQGFPKDWTRPAEAVTKRGMRWKLVGNSVNVRVATWLGERLAVPGKPILRGAQPMKRGERWPQAAFNVGEGRFTNSLSTWPKVVRRRSLNEFVGANSELLSRRATAGFLARTRRAQLRFPAGFIGAIESHLEKMDSIDHV